MISTGRVAPALIAGIAFVLSSVALQGQDARPRYRNFILGVSAEGEQQIGGIIIPDSAKEKPQKGHDTPPAPARHEDGKRTVLDVKAGDQISSASIQARRSNWKASSTHHERRRRAGPRQRHAGAKPTATASEEGAAAIAGKEEEEQK
jgi:co-chaperonin GroES (HSP10)